MTATVSTMISRLSLSLAHALSLAPLSLCRQMRVLCLWCVTARECAMNRCNVWLCGERERRAGYEWNVDCHPAEYAYIFSTVRTVSYIRIVVLFFPLMSLWWLDSVVSSLRSRTKVRGGWWRCASRETHARPKAAADQNNPHALSRIFLLLDRTFPFNR